MNDLKEDLIHALTILGENDRDIKTLTIICNPNKHRGSDTIVREEIIKILNEMVKNKEVLKKKKLIWLSDNTKKDFILYSLKNPSVS